MNDDVEALGERIAEHVAHIDAATHLLLAEIRAFDRAGGWYQQGAQSCAHWLSWRVGWSLGTAREHVRVASKLADLPQIDEALRRGEMSYCKVRAMTRVATATNEHVLLEEARFTTGQQLETICKKYAMVKRRGREGNPDDDRDRRHVTRRDQADGMVHIRAVLHPEEAAIVWAALERMAKESCREARRGRQPAVPAATRRSPDVPAGASMAAGDGDGGQSDNHHDPKVVCDSDAARVSASSRQSPDVPAGASTGAFGSDGHGPDDGRDNAHGRSMSRNAARAVRFSRADALLAMAQQILRGTAHERSPVELVVTIAADSLRDAGAPSDPMAVGCCGDSTAISRHAARRLACDAGVVALVEDADGAPLSVGRKTRSIPGAIKRALLRRDGGCRFPGCTNRLFVEGHHVAHWADGGDTRLSNLVSLCSHHHRFVHEYGYRIEIMENVAQFTDPRGHLVIASPDPASPDGRGWPTIRARNAPLEIGTETSACGWDGSRIDLVACIDELVRADDRNDDGEE